MTRLTGPEYIPSPSVKHAVIFLHGLGSNGQDLLGLAPLMADALPDTAFFSPNAPLPVEMAADGYQWFEYWGCTPMQIIDGIQAAVPMIIDYIESIRARFNLDYDNIVLCGFSQGTMMALHIGLRRISGSQRILDKALGGVIGFSGLLMSPETLMLEKLPQFPPVLLVHGLQDSVVPAMASMQAELAIRSLGGDVRYIQRPHLEHSIDETGIREAVTFCQKVFE